MLKKLFKWHRRLAWILLVPVVIWGVSGLTHPLMSNFTGVELAARGEARQSLPVEPYVSLADVLAQQAIEEFDQVRLIEMRGEHYYQIQKRVKAHQLNSVQAAGPNPWIEAEYYALRDGQHLPQGDVRYARYLARYFLGDDTSPIVETEKVTEFGALYNTVNRLLPVYRVRFERDDSADVYVDTMQSRLATANTQARRVLQWIFRTFHTWSFIGDTHNPFRLAVVISFSSLMLFMGVLGLVVYGLLWKRLKRKAKQGSVRVWHRRVGLVVALSFIGFASSGLHTVLMKLERKDSFAFQAPAKFSPKEIVQDPVARLEGDVYNFSLARMPSGNYWQLHRRNGKSKELQYINAIDGTAMENGDALYAEHLARQVSGLSSADIKPVTARTRFGGDYPVIFKRLPVQKVSFTEPERQAFFIETQTGSVAQQSNFAGFLQAMHFQWLHKYHFLDRWLSRGQRDLVLSGIVVLILGLSLMGGVLLLRRKA